MKTLKKKLFFSNFRRSRTRYRNILDPDPLLLYHERISFLQHLALKQCVRKHHKLHFFFFATLSIPAYCRLSGTGILSKNGSIVRVLIGAYQYSTGLLWLSIVCSTSVYIISTTLMAAVTDGRVVVYLPGSYQLVCAVVSVLTQSGHQLYIEYITLLNNQPQLSDGLRTRCLTKLVVSQISRYIDAMCR